LRKGTLQPIKIAVKTRQGRKMVTLITGMETFGVDPDEMAEELKKIRAGSATGEWSGGGLACLGNVVQNFD
jgi:translation initiation factor 2D